MVRPLRVGSFSTVVVAALALCAAPGISAGTDEVFRPSFFHSAEVRSENLKPFKKWRTALERYSRETAEERAGNCQAALFNTCHYEELQRFLDGVRGKDRWAQLVEINHYMNTRPYITDPRMQVVVEQV